MEVTGHAATGAAGGAMLGLVPGLITTNLNLGIAIVGCAGFALLPDIDHPKATAAQTFGWPSKAIAHVVETFCGWIYVSTRTGRDQLRHGGHRTLTHTLLFSLGMGALTLWAATNKLALLLILFVGLCWGIRGFFPKTLKKAKFKLMPRTLRKWFPKSSAKLFLYIVASILPLFMLADRLPTPSAWFMAMVVGWGSLIHCLGDCLTDSGAPLLYPLPIGKQLWYRFKAPARFNTGSELGKHVERLIKLLCLGIILFILFIRWYTL